MKIDVDNLIEEIESSINSEVSSTQKIHAIEFIGYVENLLSKTRPR